MPGCVAASHLIFSRGNEMYSPSTYTSNVMRYGQDEFQAVLKCRLQDYKLYLAIGPYDSGVQ